MDEQPKQISFRVAVVIAVLFLCAGYFLGRHAMRVQFQGDEWVIPATVETLHPPDTVPPFNQHPGPNTTMAVGDVHVVFPGLRLTGNIELDELQTKLGFELPRGYGDYLKTLGDGELCNTLHVLTPREVLDPENDYLKSLIPAAIEGGYWDDRQLLSDDELYECVIFARTANGDYLVACPSRPGELFELPHSDSRMTAYATGFAVPFEFECIRQLSFEFPFFIPSQPDVTTYEFRFDNSKSLAEAWTIIESHGTLRYGLRDEDLNAEGEEGYTQGFVQEIWGEFIVESDRMRARIWKGSQDDFRPVEAALRQLERAE